MNANEDKNDTDKHLKQMGWTPHFQSQLDEISQLKTSPARVIGVSRKSFQVSDGKDERSATAAGRLSYHSDSLYPVIGDWVLMKGTVISKVLERRNVLSRQAAGTRGRQSAGAPKEQLIAANLDTVFIVCGLDRDFNLSRIERYLILVYNCGLSPVIILTKADLQKDPDSFVSEVEPIASGVPIYAVSLYDNQGFVPLEKYLSLGQTAILVGSSGAGKSTLLNQLYGENVQATGSVSDSEGKGKHTTTSRDLIMMPQGGMVIDNPGIREISFTNDDGGIDEAFPDIEKLAEKCRFSDCSHMHEPGCRVLQAVADGELAKNRLQSFRKIQRELSYSSERQSKSAAKVEKERWKNVALKVKAMKKKSDKKADKKIHIKN